MNLVTYRIDAGDLIESVSDSWAPFAISNEGTSVATDVVGRPLWDFVSDGTTRQIYRDLLARVRGGRTLHFSFRCDSPALRRFMRMTMSPGPEAAVTFDSLVVKVERRESIVLPSRPEPDNLMMVCAWCNRVAVAERWVEIEVAVEQLGALAGSAPAGLTHGMCPDCFARVLAETDAA